MDDFISASYDIAFKALFVRNQDLLRPFLSDILNISFSERDEIDLLNTELPPDTADGKLSRLDILAKVGGEVFNIEMQARKDGFTPKRTFYYLKSIFALNFKAGDEYENIERAYSVNILDFYYFDCRNYYSSFSFRENTRFEQLADDLSIHYFELPKVPKEKRPGDRKQKWMELIKAKNEEELEMVRTTSESVAIQDGVDAVLALNSDFKFRERVRMRQKAVLDYGNEMAYAKRTSRAEGRAEGLIEGELKKQNEIVENMRKNGFTDEQIRMALGTF